MSKNERWPENCIWPEPLWEGEGEYWDYDLAMSQELDEYGEELKEIKYYMDRLVEEGVLDDDYCLTEEDFTPEMGEDFWDNGFDVICWESALSDHINRFKLDICDPDPVSIIVSPLGDLSNAVTSDPIDSEDVP